MKWLVPLAMAMLALPLASADVLLVDVKGTINSADTALMKNALSYAEANKMDALILGLHTPGGAVQDTLNMVEAIESSPVPVIGFVEPGGYAWSAGTLLLLSSDVSAMAPYAVIGSAQPVSIGLSGAEPIEDQKTLNALAALFAAKARAHGKNGTAAMEFVTKNLNLDGSQAYAQHVIDFVASSPEDALKLADGIEAKGRTLRTAGETIILYDPGAGIGILSIISDPILAAILLLAGIYALIFGLHSPGLGSEIAGILLIIMGLVGLGLNINAAAIALIVLGVALLLAELSAPGFGVLGAGGIMSLVLGSLFLVPIAYPGYLISSGFTNQLLLAVLAPSMIIAVFFAFALYKVAEIRRRKPLFADIVGEKVVAVDTIAQGETGFVRYRGELWQASSLSAVAKGSAAVVKGKSGSVLQIEPYKPEKDKRRRSK